MIRDDINGATENLAESLDSLFQSRQTTIDSFLNLQSLANVAFSSEAARLEKLYGAGDPRTRSMKSRLDSNQTVLRTLEVQRGLASIRPEPKAEGEVLVEGWVGD